ncbi:MAG: 30S ribosomal protein S2, partial [Minisyncoccia bacterium]
LEQTDIQIANALKALVDIKSKGLQVLFVGTKPEAKGIVRSQAELIDMPFVTERWLGGTLTNRRELKGRVERLLMLTEQSEKGELVAANKKERLMLGREMEKLERKFGGIKNMKKLPAALFVIDPKKEYIAVDEARQMNIPVIALANTDCDVSIINYPIVANDTNLSSITFFTKKVADTLK